MRDRDDPDDTSGLLAAIVESSTDAIISQNLDGIVTSWNIGAEKMFGYSAAEMIGRSIRSLIPADRQSEEDHALAASARGETIQRFETVRVRKDGSQVAISLSVSPVRDSAGTIIGVSKIARDITDRKRVERESQLLAAIVASSEDAIVSKDLNGIVQSWNRSAERMFGYTAEEAVGRSITIIIPNERLEEEDLVLGRIRAGLSVEHFETVRRRKDGTEIDISLSVSPIRAGNGQVIGASKVARDITEQKRLARQLEHANRLKDEFLATLSHELRTPLNAIVGYARMLRTGIIDADRQARALEIIERNSHALTQLVSDVLDVSRIVTGKLRLDVQPTDLSRVVEAAIDSVRPAFDAKGLRLELIVDPQTPLVSGDGERLQQVFWNLLVNAAKFTPRGGRVQVRLARVSSHVEFAVSDTGVGITPEFLPHTFERFRQADTGTTRHYGGLGLGLALVRHFVELHGGTVDVASEGSGRGATFRVALPIMIVHRRGSASEVHPTQGGADMPIVPERQLTGVSVLAVDDDVDSLMLLADTLQWAGADVWTAVSAEAAIGRLHTGRPDVIVADIGMPDVDGFRFIEILRTNPLWRDIPAAALTAYARAEDRTRALLAGFQMHLAKPIEPAELIAAVRSLARGATA